MGPHGTLAWSTTPPDPGLTPLKIMVGASRDGGQSFANQWWSSTCAVPPPKDEAEPYFTEEVPAIAADPSHAGRLAAAWPDNRSATSRILLRFSRDSGATWSPIVDVADDPPGHGNQHDHVALTYLGDGRLAVVWRDRRYTGGSYYHRAPRQVSFTG